LLDIIRKAIRGTNQIIKCYHLVIIYQEIQIFYKADILKYFMEQKGEDTKVYSLSPVVTRIRQLNNNYVAVAIYLGILLILVEIFALFLLDLSTLLALIFGVFLIICYAVALFFLLDPEFLTEINKTKVISYHPSQIIAERQPVVKEQQAPIIKEQIRYVEVPREKIVEKIVEVPRKKLVIPKYEFIGSSETKVYHKRSCRFRKLIKRKYQVNSNDIKYFTSKKYTPCKVCLKNSKK